MIDSSGFSAERLRRRSVAVSVHDLRFDEPDDAVYAGIGGADVAVVCSTDYDLAQCYPTLVPAAQCVRRIKAAGTAVVACVGSHGTAEAELTRSFTGADVVVAGEFEFAVPERGRGAALRCWVPGALAGRGDPAGDRGGAGRARSAGVRPGADGPVPQRGLRRRRARPVNSGLLLANRGCPYACDFCYLFFGRRLRQRPVEATLAELRTMHDVHGIRHFFFLDYTFTMDRTWVRELCAGIQRLDLRISWVCQTRVDCLDEPTLAAMKAAGAPGYGSVWSRRSWNSVGTSARVE